MRNQVYEQLLDKQGVSWEYVESLPISEINVNKSLNNQARLDNPLDEGLIDSYTQSMKDGFEFPPLVVWRPGKGMWLLIDGNNRLAAKLKLSHKTTDVYMILNSDPKVIDRITWRWNNLVNGKRLSPEESMQHAVSYCRKYNTSYKEAAKEWGVNENSLSQKVKVEESKDILRSNNVKITPALDDYSIRLLQGLRSVGEDLFCEAATVVATTGATSEDVEEMLREVKRAKNVEGKQFIVREFASSAKVQSRKAETKGGTTKVRPNAPREKFQRLLREIRNVLEDNTADALRPVQGEMKQFREMGVSVVEHLDTILKLGVIPTAGREVG